MVGRNTPDRSSDDAGSYSGQSSDFPSSKSGDYDGGSSFGIGVDHLAIEDQRRMSALSRKGSDSYTTTTNSQSEVIDFPLLSSKDYEQDAASGTEHSVYIGDIGDMGGDSSSDNLVNIEKQMVSRKGVSPLVKSTLIIIASFVVLFVFAYSPILGPEKDAAQKCLAILLFAAVMWATEAVPLYQTALIIPVMSVLFQVILDPNDPTARLPREEALTTLFKSMFSSTLMLVIAGFSMSATLQRFKIDALVASTILAKVVRKGPTLYIAVVLVMGFILSAIVNNITTPLLLLSFTKPHLDALPTNSRLRKAVLCAIMVSANVGGMATPIASPQSAVVIQISQQYDLGINFGNFIAVAFPTGFVMIAAGFVVIRFIFFRGNIGDFPKECYMTPEEIAMLELEEENRETETDILKSSNDTELSSRGKKRVRCCKAKAKANTKKGKGKEREREREKEKEKGRKGRKGRNRDLDSEMSMRKEVGDKPKKKKNKVLIFTYVVIGMIIVGGIILWAIIDEIKESFGNSFIVSCLVITLLYGTGLLPDTAITEKIPWNIILLLVGGNALGAAVRTSQLLTIINDVLNMMNSLPGYVILLICCLFMWIIGSLIGHTIASLILLPIFASFALTANGGLGIGVTAGVFVVVTNLMCSGEMCLPVSSFPNITISGLVNSEGNKILSTGFILGFGVSMTLVDMIVAMSVGYGISGAMF